MKQIVDESSLQCQLKNRFNNNQVMNQQMHDNKTKYTKKIVLYIAGLILFCFCLGMCFKVSNLFGINKQKDVIQIQNYQKRILLSNNKLDQVSQNLITICDVTIQITTSIANSLKILFQLTALLFIITDLINFWGLASIYIFLPIQIPIFAKNILQDAWTNFNLPILQYIGLSFSIPSLNSSQLFKFSYLNQNLWQYLQLQMLQMMFQPSVIFTITALELYLFHKILNYIKKKFRLIRKQIQQQHASKNFKKLKNKEILLKAIQSQIKYKKSQIKSKKNQINSKKEENKLVQDKIQKQKLENSKLQIKKEDSINYNTFNQQFSQKKIDVNQNQQKQNYNKPKSIVFNSILINIVRKISLKKSKHWSQQIRINKLQIFAALIISYMPQLLLPLFNVTSHNNMKTLLQKINYMLYYILLFFLFTFPFIYLMISYNSRKFKKSQRQEKNNTKLIKNGKQKDLKIHLKYLKRQTIQTFFQFYLNISIPVLVGVTSNPLIFLIVNLMMLILYVFLDVTFHKANNFYNKIQKINNIIQKITFLCYHFIFLILHIFNVCKQELQSMNVLSSQQVTVIFNYLGASIILVFAFGGIHQLSQFLIKFLFNVFKIIYMIFRVCMGKYQIQKERQQKEVLQQKKIKKQKAKKHLLNSQDNIVPQNSDNLTQIQEEFDIQILKNKIEIQKLKMKNKKDLSKEVIQKGVESPQNQFKIFPLEINQQLNAQNNQQLNAQFDSQHKLSNSEHKIFKQSARKQKIVKKRIKFIKREKKNNCNAEKTMQE